MNSQDLFDWIYHQRPDGSAISMKMVGLFLGLGLVLKHLFGLLQAQKVQAVAKDFPRNRAWGVVLLIIGTVWTLFLVAHMDMADFFTYRRALLMGLPIASLLVILYVPEFLAVRALGSLMLLAASPVLHSAFLQPQTSRLLLPVLAYAWIIVGMFFVGMPYLMRDWINWVTARQSRWKAAMVAGLAYGSVMLVAAVLWY
jgi:hypothetical protein